MVIRGKVNAQPSDLKPGATSPDQQRAIDIQAEEEYQKNSAKAGTPLVKTAKDVLPPDKAAQKEAYKKMVEQRSATTKTAEKK